MVTRFYLPYGSGALPFEGDAEELEPPQSAAASDETAAVRRALEQPIGAPPLREIVRRGESVAVIVNDITRLARSEVFLPPLLDTLNAAGVPDDDVFIVFALGTHRKQTDAERHRIVGAEVAGRVRLYDHDGKDDANLVTVGTTSFGNRVEINRRVWEADRIILTGEIIQHQIAGYSGGRKSLVPGVAGNRTITFNHRMIFDPRCRAGVLDGNPAHEDLLEAARFAEPDFLLNVILSPSGKLLRVVAGHFEEAHRAGCRAADELLSTELSAPYEMVVASAGGHPLDIDLRQAHKGMENACRALRPGGCLLYYAACPDGLGSEAMARYFDAYADDREMEQALRENFVIGGHKAYWLARLGRQYDVHLVTELDERLVKRCGFHPVPPAEHESRFRELRRGLASGARVAVMRHAGFTVPKLPAYGEQTA